MKTVLEKIADPDLVHNDSVDIAHVQMVDQAVKHAINTMAHVNLALNNPHNPQELADDLAYAILTLKNALYPN